MVIAKEEAVARAFEKVVTTTVTHDIVLHRPELWGVGLIGLFPGYIQIGV
jgi:hypothetical protein